MRRSTRTLLHGVLSRAEYRELKAFIRWARKMRAFTGDEVGGDGDSLADLQTEIQWLRRNQAYLLRRGSGPPRAEGEAAGDFRAREFRVGSRRGQDGVLAALLEFVGTRAGGAVRLGGDHPSSNIAWCAACFSLQSVEITGSGDALLRLRSTYRDLLGVPSERYTLIRSHPTEENVVRTLEWAGIGPELDLLSIEDPAQAHALWGALGGLDPRVVALAYAAPPALASLEALAKLSEGRGYRLVGCDSTGASAFWVKAELLCDPLRALSPQEAYRPPLGDDLRPLEAQNPSSPPARIEGRIDA